MSSVEISAILYLSQTRADPVPIDLFIILISWMGLSVKWDMAAGFLLTILHYADWTVLLIRLPLVMKGEIMMKPVRTYIIIVLLALLTASLTWYGTQALSRQDPLYVKAIPSGDADCRDWANACDLQYALNKAGDGMEIWLAVGIH